MTQVFIQTVLAALNDRLAAQPLDKTVSLRIRDIGNIRIERDTATVSDEHADCAIIADQATFQKILDGQINPIKAAMFGKLGIKGDAGTALAFGKLFA